ncbi:MAG: hypothetical protein JO023_02590 [Chloroflexi bacterium]|nr:hypothetical protein [Chloroflexota bacterium]
MITARERPRLRAERQAGCSDAVATTALTHAWPSSPAQPMVPPRTWLNHPPLKITKIVITLLAVSTMPA